MKVHACMIVRNEEKHIRRCIASIREKVDATWVLDTGSVDATMDIVREVRSQPRLGPVLVTGFPWQGDFSDSRNKVLHCVVNSGYGYAGNQEASTDWVFVIDADQELDAAADLRATVEAAEARGLSAIYCTEIHLGHQTTSRIGRLFRLEPGIRYHRRVHEELRKDGKPLTWYPPPVGHEVNIINHGYQGDPREVMLPKFIRNRDLMYKQLAEEPEDRYLEQKLIKTLLGIEELRG